jgi:hypothetical protein
MKQIPVDITLALILVIPFHGIFLSVLFFIKSGSYIPNFFLGLLLLVISSLILFQIYCFQIKSFSLFYTYYYFKNELIISPFLFLYNTSILRPAETGKIDRHILLTASAFFLFILSCFVTGLTRIIISVILYMINGLYLFWSVQLLNGTLKNHDDKWKDLLFKEYTGIIFLNLLVFVTIVISTLVHTFYLGNIVFFTQIPKGMIIYYIYYRILN